MRVTLALVGLAAACSSSESGALIPVDVRPGVVTGIATIDIKVTDTAGQMVTTKRFDWKTVLEKDEVAKVGVYLPPSFEGSAAVQAIARDSLGAAIGASAAVNSSVQKGQRAATVMLNLLPYREMPDGGTGGTSGTGGSGTGGMGGGGTGGGGAGGTGGGGTGGSPTEAGTDGPMEMPPVIEATWTPATNIEMDPVSPSATPDVAIDGAGNSIVAWRDTGAKVRRYDATTRTWGTPKILEDRGVVDGVMVAGAGSHALVIWHLRTSEAPAGARGLWASHSRDFGVTWGAAQHVHDGPIYYDMALVMAPTGAARVAWQESMNNLNTLWSAHFDPAAGTFSGAAVVRPGDDSNERYPKLAIDAAGAGLLAWVQDDDGGNDTIWAAAFTGATLAAAQIIDAYTTDNAGEVDLAMAPMGGRGLAVWQQRNGSTSAEIHAAEWVAGQGWKPPARVLGAAWVHSPAVVIDRGGAATMAFVQPITGNKWNVMATRWTAQGGWAMAQPLETSNESRGNGEHDPIPHLGADDAGNVHAVWRRRTSPTGQANTLVVRRYAAATSSWEPEVVLGAVPTLRAYHPELAVAGGGRAAATFYFQDPDNTSNAMAYNVFVAFYR